MPNNYLDINQKCNTERSGRSAPKRFVYAPLRPILKHFAPLRAPEQFDCAPLRATLKNFALLRSGALDSSGVGAGETRRAVLIMMIDHAY